MKIDLSTNSLEIPSELLLKRRAKKETTFKNSFKPKKMMASKILCRSKMG